MNEPNEIEEKLKHKANADAGTIRVSKPMSFPRALDLAIEALAVAYSRHRDNGTVNTAKSLEMAEASKRLVSVRDDIQRQISRVTP